MTFKIDDFKSVFESGFARPNRYKVIMPRNPAGNGDPYRLNIMCDSVTMPGRQIFTQDLSKTLKTNKVAYSFDSRDVTISFILDNDWYPWEYINSWHSSIIPNVEGARNFAVGFKDDYTEQIEIEHYNEANEINNAVILKEAFPVTLSSIDLGNANSGEVIRVEATFTYDNWEIR